MVSSEHDPVLGGDPMLKLPRPWQRPRLMQCELQRAASVQKGPKYVNTKYIAKN